LPEVQSVALLIGQNGKVGKWQAVEMHSFISQAVEAGLPVIPVLIFSAYKLAKMCDLGYTILVIAFLTQL